MKITNCLVMCLLSFALPAFSQAELHTNSDSASIIAARSQYSRVDTDAGQDAGAAPGALAQYSRPRRPFHPPTRSPRMTGYPGGYPSMYMGESSGRHVLIGALIGFGLGAALAAKANTDQHPGVGVKAAFLVGGVGALIGAAVGRGVPSFPSRYRRGRWPYDEQNSSVRSRRKNVHAAVASRTGPEDDPAGSVSVISR